MTRPRLLAAVLGLVLVAGPGIVGACGFVGEAANSGGTRVPLPGLGGDDALDQRLLVANRTAIARDLDAAIESYHSR